MSFAPTVVRIRIHGGIVEADGCRAAPNSELGRIADPDPMAHKARDAGVSAPALAG